MIFSRDDTNDRVVVWLYAAVLYSVAGYFAYRGSHSVVDALLAVRAFSRAMRNASTHPFTCPTCGHHEYTTLQLPYGGLERKCLGLTPPGQFCTFGWPADLDCVFLRFYVSNPERGPAPPHHVDSVEPAVHVNRARAAPPMPDDGAPDTGPTFEEGGEE